MADTETFPMTMDMTVAVQGLVNLFLNMDVNSRRMFIKLLIVRMEEEEVDLILEVVDMRNTSNTGVNTRSVREDDVKIEAGQCFDDSNHVHNYEIENSNDKNTEDEKMDLHNDGSLSKPKEEPELTKNEPEDMLEMFVCEFCSKSCKNQKNLYMHIRQTHKKGNILNCDQCSYKTAAPGDMKNHKRTHTGERPYVCHICCKTFSTSSHLNRHIKGVHMGEKVHNSYSSKGEKNFLCDICSLAFSTPQTLRMHKESIHEGIRYDCDQCDYKATDKGNLARHVATIHGGIKFGCQECGYQASSKQTLKNHEELVHLGITHECSQCDHKAHTKSNLLQHISYVHESIQHECSECDHKAKSKSNLVQHISYVHESIQHDCKECDYTTFKKRSFHKHMTNHRKAQALQNQTDYYTRNPFGMNVN